MFACAYYKYSYYDINNCKIMKYYRKNKQHRNIYYSLLYFSFLQHSIVLGVKLPRYCSKYK